MKKILLGSVATGALVAAGSANAADLGRPVYKAPPVAAPVVPPFSWTGCFVGAHGGYGWGRKDVTATALSEGDHGITHVEGSRSGSIDTHGAIFGGQIGCDYQFGVGKGLGGPGAWVIGIQWDFAGATLVGENTSLSAHPDATVTQAIKVHTDWLTSLTGRLGFTGWIPQTLIYIRGGGAWVREKWNFIDQDFHTPDRFEFSDTRSGWTIGGGIEYAICPNWSVFAEFNHYDFGHKTFSQFGSAGINRVDFDTKQRIEAVRLGVNFRFGNWLGKGKAPVVAKY
jgi:outer membrane immunogenic protein